MRVSTVSVLALGLLVAASRTIACANGDVQELPDGSVATPDASETPRAEGSTPVGIADASDAAEDAAEDADDASELVPCSPDGFCHTQLPGPTPDPDGGIPRGVTRDLDLRDVWMAADGEAFSVSASGDLIGWRDDHWTVLLETGLPLQHIWAENADDLWLAASAEVVVHVTRDGNGAYQARSEPTGSMATVDELLGIGDRLWIVTGDGTLLLRDPATGLWHDDPFALDVQGSNRSGRVEAIWRNGDEVWARGSQYDDTVFYQNLLLHWQPSAADAGADDAGIGGDDDAGETVATSWKTVPLVAGPYVWQGSVSTGVDVDTFLLCASFNCDRVTRATHQEAGWVGQDEPTEIVGRVTATDLWAGSTSDAWLIGTQGTVRHYDGTTWSLARIAYRLPVVTDLRAVTGRVDPSGGSELWIVGNNIAMHKRGAP